MAATVQSGRTALCGKLKSCQSINEQYLDNRLTRDVVPTSFLTVFDRVMVTKCKHVAISYKDITPTHRQIWAAINTETHCRAHENFSAQQLVIQSLQSSVT